MTVLILHVYTVRTNALTLIMENLERSGKGHGKSWNLIILSSKSTKLNPDNPYGDLDYSGYHKNQIY